MHNADTLDGEKNGNWLTRLFSRDESDERIAAYERIHQHNNTSDDHDIGAEADAYNSLTWLDRLRMNFREVTDTLANARAENAEWESDWQQTVEYLAKAAYWNADSISDKDLRKSVRATMSELEGTLFHGTIKAKDVMNMLKNATPEQVAGWRTSEAQEDNGQALEV